MLAKNRKLNLADASVRLRLKKFSGIQTSSLYVRRGVGKAAAMVVVSNHVAKKATLRNKIKRHLYNALRKILAENPTTQLVVFVRRLAPISTLIEELFALIRK